MHAPLPNPLDKQENLTKSAMGNSADAHAPKPSSLIRRVQKIARSLLAYGAIACTTIGLNNLEAGFFSRERSTTVTSPNKALTIKGNTFGPFIPDSLSLLPAVLESQLRCVALYDPLILKTLHDGIRLEVLPSYNWEHSKNTPCIFDSGAIKVNGAFLYDILDGKNRSCEDLSPEDRAQYAGYILTPHIVVDVHREKLFETLKNMGGDENQATCAETVAAEIILESTVRQTIKEILPNTVVEATMWNVIAPASRLPNCPSEYLLGANFAELSEILNTSWNIPKLESSLNTKLADPVSTEVSGILRVCGSNQKARLTSSIEEVKQVRAGETEPLIVLNPLATWLPPSYREVAASNLLLHRVSALGTSSCAQLSATQKMDLTQLLTSMVDEFEQSIDQVTNVQDDKELLKPYCNLSLALEIGANLGRAIRACSTIHQQPLLETQLKEQLFRLNAAAKNALAETSQNEASIRYYHLHPAICEINRVISQLGFIDDSTVSDEIEGGDEVLAEMIAAFKQNNPEKAPEALISPETLKELTPNELAWLTLLLHEGSISTTDNVPRSGYFHGWYQFNDIREFLQTPSFTALTNSAQARILRTFLPSNDGAPRLIRYLRGLEVVANNTTVERLDELQEFIEHCDGLPRLEASLLVEAYCLIPNPVQALIPNVHSSDIPAIDRKLLWLLAPSREGPLIQNITKIFDNNSAYAQVNLDLLLRDSIFKTFPRLGWPGNVSIFTSSDVDQYSFAAPLGVSYAGTLMDQLAQGKTLEQAQAHLQDRYSRKKFHVSHLVVWLNSGLSRILEGSWDSSLSVGIERQFPQMNAQQHESFKPTHALILYGDNRPRDLGPWLKLGAKRSQDFLERNYQVNCNVASPSSDEELDSAVTSLLNESPKPLKESGQLLIVIMGHGAAASASNNFRINFPDRASESIGVVSLAKDYQLSELNLKEIVNLQLAPKFKSINIIVFSCHSGAWLH